MKVQLCTTFFLPGFFFVEPISLIAISASLVAIAPTLIRWRSKLLNSAAVVASMADLVVALDRLDRMKHTRVRITSSDGKPLADVDLSESDAANKVYAALTELQEKN
jgi:hypothetical protein